jgi:hypothetical protein
MHSYKSIAPVEPYAPFPPGLAQHPDGAQGFDPHVASPLETVQRRSTLRELSHFRCDARFEW